MIISPRGIHNRRTGRKCYAPITQSNAAVVEIDAFPKLVRVVIEIVPVVVIVVIRGDVFLILLEIVVVLFVIFVIVVVIPLLSVGSL